MGPRNPLKGGYTSIEGYTGFRITWRSLGLSNCLQLGLNPARSCGKSYEGV